ncbi:hypothetical protein BGZ63DRAFT_228394 [Mariannaea sp. PMI_226]|nr:hypothetical protein BGZ63DRAFT_228394 [Mariannaea sp. PMI_226]
MEYHAVKKKKANNQKIQSQESLLRCLSFNGNVRTRNPGGGLAPDLLYSPFEQSLQRLLPAVPCTMVQLTLRLLCTMDSSRPPPRYSATTSFGQLVPKMPSQRILCFLLMVFSSHHGRESAVRKCWFWPSTPGTDLCRAACLRGSPNRGGGRGYLLCSSFWAERGREGKC